MVDFCLSKNTADEIVEIFIDFFQQILYNVCIT